MLFSKANINGMELRNRIIMTAIHTGFSADGRIGQRDLDFYRARAEGGAAAVTLVAAVNKNGALKGMHLLEDSGGFAELADMLHNLGCRLIVQLFHCGRNMSEKTAENAVPLAPSALSSIIYGVKPKEMTTDEILETEADFARAAEFCKNNGADAVEISASAGYLVSQFLSPTSNRREDIYGKELDRFAIETAEAVRKAVGRDFPVIIKVSASQMTRGGYTIRDTIELCKKLESSGLIDAISVTGGWHESPVPQISYHVPKGGFAMLADSVKRAVSLPVIACNRITDAETAERILSSAQADFAGMARGFLADAGLAGKLERGESFNICQGCNRCIESVLRDGEAFCVYNPDCGRESEENKRRRIATMKRALVIGGGPGGMTAAKKAAERGYKTTLITNEGKLGGQLNIAAMPPGKQDILLYIKNLELELEKLGVEIVLNKTAGIEDIKRISPYFVVCACGSRPSVPDIKGLSDVDYHIAADVFNAGPELLNKIKRGKTAIIGGGSLGLELSMFLCEKCSTADARSFFAGELESCYVPPDITIIEQGPKAGIELGSTRGIVLAEVKELGVSVITSANIESVQKGCIILNKNGTEKSLAADNIIIAAGSVPAPMPFVDYLLDERISYSVIGDAAGVADAGKAISDAAELFSRVFIA